MRLIVFIILMLAFSLSLPAQLQLTPVFDRCWDSNEGGGRSHPLPDGSGYIIYGGSRLDTTYGVPHHGINTGSWNRDASIAITDNDFNILKGNIFGGTLSGDDDDYFKKVIPQADGGFICFGQVESIDGDIGAIYGFTAGLLKVDSNLNIVWSRPYNKSTTSMNAGDCIQSRFGDLYVVGGTPGVSGDNNIDIDGNPLVSDWTLVKYDENGNKIWAKVYGSTGDENGLPLVIEDRSGSIYIAGSSYGSDLDLMAKDTTWKMGLNTLQDIFVVKLDSAGNRLWSQSYGSTNTTSSGQEWPLCILYDSINNEIVMGGGTSSNDLTFSSAQYAGGEGFFMRLDTAGAVLQVKTIGGDGADYVQDISLGPQPNTYFLGISTQSSNTGDMTNTVPYIFLTLLNQQGNLLMKHSYNNPGLWGNGYSQAYYNTITNDVILTCAVGGDVSLLCDTSIKTGNNAKPATRRLRFDPLSIDNLIAIDNGFKIYPNPVQSNITIHYEKQSPINIALLNMDGRVLLNKNNVLHSATISLEAYPTGLYIVQLKTKKNTFYHKILKY